MNNDCQFKFSRSNTPHYYQHTKEFIEKGGDVEWLRFIIANALKVEDYEAAEGIRLAVADLGIELTIPGFEREEK